MSRLIDPVSKEPITPEVYPLLNDDNVFESTNEFGNDTYFEGNTRFNGGVEFNSDVGFPGSINSEGIVSFDDGYLQFVDLSPGQGVRKHPVNGELEAYPVYGSITHNNAATVEFNSNDRFSEFIYSDSTTTKALLDLHFPTDFSPGQVCRYFTAGICTSVNLNGPTLLGAPLTSLAANQTVAWIAVDTGGTLIRIQ